MKGIEKLAIRETAQGVILPVKAVPGASRDRIVGVLGDSLKIATSAAPEKGKANAAIVSILAKALRADARNVQLTSGSANQRKEFLILGISVGSTLKKLSEL